MSGAKLSPGQQVEIGLQISKELASRSMLGNYAYILVFFTLYWVADLSLIHPDLMFYAGIAMVALCMARGYMSLQISAWHHRIGSWNTWFSLLTLSITALWCSLTIHQWHECGLTPQTMLLLLLVFAIALGATPVLSIHLNLYRLFSVVLFLPLVVFGYMQPDNISISVAHIFLVGLAFSLAIAAKMGSEYRENIEYVMLMHCKEDEVNHFAAQARAESAAKSTFLANMSHEIRTPMNGVMGMTEMLQKTHLSHQQQSYVKVIHRSADALLSIINDILDYSKMESGNLHLESLPLSLRGMLGEVMALMAHKGRSKGLEVILDIAPEVPDTFIADEGRIRQMLLNLMGNAFKFTQEGEVKVSIATELIEQDTYWLRFSVSDTGIGIPEEAQHKLFDSFSQADNTTTRRFGGTGLGLAICFQLAKLMQGEIHLESNDGEGSRFSFIIPLQLDAQQHTAQDMLSDEDTAALAWLQQKKVLVVDDNDNVRRVLCHQLSAWGIQYDAVDSAIEAWHKLTDAEAKQDFALALLDMHMPGIDGLDLASMIRGNHRLATMRLVMLCSGENDAEQIKQSSAFIDDFIYKPVEQHPLLQCLVASKAHPLEESNEEQTAAELEAVPTEAGSLHILIAEDNPVNQQVLVAMLDLLGCHAEIANNGLEVLSAVESQTFDLILMDCHMPQMDGLEATRQIRQHQDKYGQVNIVALTANAMPEDKERCTNAGMDGYLSKPFTQDQLKNVISKYAPPLGEKSTKKADADALVSQQVQALTTVTSLVNPQVQAVLDEDSLHNLRQLQQPGGADILQQVLAMYLDDAPHHVQHMRDALAAHDGKKLNLAAHTLKSSSANIGALDLAEQCANIERLTNQAWQEKQLLPYIQRAEASFEVVSHEIITQHLQAEAVS